MAHLVWIVPLVLSIAYLASPRFRSNIAETRVRRLLATGLEKSRYTVFNDITLPSAGGTVHIDHLVVSRFGIFVIESQYAPGRVSGEEFQDRWKVEHWRRTSRLDNPLHRNTLQAEAVAGILEVPTRALHPLVVMVGQKQSGSAWPERVLTPERLLAHIRKKARSVIEGEQADQAIRKIEATRIQSLGRPAISKWQILQITLILVLLAGVWFTFRDQLSGLRDSLGAQREQQSAPELFHPDGARKSSQEVWEDSLVCAYSADTGRCACYESGGSKVELDPDKCRSLAERGSVLRQ